MSRETNIAADRSNIYPMTKEIQYMPVFIREDIPVTLNVKKLRKNSINPKLALMIMPLIFIFSFFLPLLPIQLVNNSNRHSNFVVHKLLNAPDVFCSFINTLFRNE
jgi:hypothetical protein